MPGLTLESALTGVDLLDKKEKEPALGAPPISVQGATDSINVIESNRAREGVSAGVAHNPDQRAKDVELGEGADLHPDIVQSDRNGIQRQITTNNILRTIENTPSLRSMMSDSDFAAIAHDDVDNLSWWESTKAGFSRGILEREEGLQGVVHRAVQAEEASPALKSIREQLSNLPEEPETGFASFLAWASKVVGQQYSSMADPRLPVRVGGGAVTGAAVGAAGGPLAPATASLGATLGAGAGFFSHLTLDALEIEMGHSYLEQMDEKVDPAVARWTSLGVGVVNAGFEMASNVVLLRPLVKAGKQVFKQGIREIFKRTSVKTAVKEFTVAYGAGIGAEVSTEVLQELVSIVGTEVGKRFSEDDLDAITSDEILDRVEQIAVGTFKAMVLLAAPGPGTKFVVDVGQSKKAKSNQEILQGVKENAKESKLQTRAPKKYSEYVDKAMAGSENETVRISGDGLVELFQTNPEMVEEFREIIPDLDNKLAEAQLQSGDVEISTGEYAAFIADREGAESLVDHVRLKEDDMTMAEAKDFDSTQQERLIENYKQYESEIEALQEGEEAGQVIFEDVERMLISAERTPQEAKAAATLHRNFFTTMAERVNQSRAPEDHIDAWQLYSGQKLSVVKRKEVQPPVEGRQYEQEVGRIDTPPVQPDGSVELIHYSNIPDLTVLDPEKHGAGIRGAEAKRKKTYPEHYLDRTYFGIAPGQEGGYTKEPGLGIQEYKVNIPMDRLYDFRADPDKLHVKGPDTGLAVTQYEEFIKDAGYAGYWVSDPSLGLTAAVFEKTTPIPFIDVDSMTLDDILSSPELINTEENLRENYNPTAAITTSERKQLRVDIADELYADGAGKKNKEVWVVIGPPGAGKSSYIDPLVESEGVLVVDSDLAKERLPEFQGGIGANNVHLESKGIAKEVLKRALESGDNIAYPIVGKDEAKVLREIEVFKSHSYKIHLRLIDLDLDKAIRRTVKRYTETGRYVSLDYVYNEVGYKPMETFSHLAREGIADDNEAYNADVPKGQSPQKIQDYEEFTAERSDETGKRRIDRGVAEEVTFEQPGDDTRRGLIQFTTTGDTIISLFEKANESTFLHETGHMFLGSFKAMAALPDAPQQILDDWQTVLNFLGSKDGSITKAQHEQWARTFEAYIREGNAPTEGLREVFRTYKRWLLRIYESMKQLDVTLSDDVRGVMDRMFASDQQIDRAERLNQYQESAQSVGVRQKDLDSINKATERAKEKLLAKIMKQITRQTKSWWKQESEELQKEVTEEFQNKRKYKVKAWLQTGKLPDGSELVLLGNTIEHLKLSIADLTDIYGDASEAKWRGLPKGKYGVVAKEGGVHPDVIAAMFGYPSGDAVLNDLLTTGKIQTDIKTETHARMLQRHGDILNDGTIETEAQEAVHNASRTTVLLSEIRTISKQLKQPTLSRQAVRLAAKQIIEGKQSKDLKPGQYLRAERTLTDKMIQASQAGKWEEALQHAHQRLLNYFLYMEGRDALSKANTIQKYMRRIRTRKYNTKDVDPTYVTQLKLLANAFDFRKKTTPEQMRQIKRDLVSLVRWVMGQQKKDTGIAIPEILDRSLARIQAAIEHADDTGASINELLANIPIKNFGTMTIGELTDVYNMARHLRFIGGKNSEQARLDLAETAQELADTVIEHGGDTVEVIDDQTWYDKAKNIMKRLSYDQIKLLTDIRQFDGFADFGPLFKSIYQPIVDATNRRINMDLKAVQDLKEIFSPYEKVIKPKHDIRTLTKQTGDQWSLSLRERVMLAVYWGSPESREAVLQGYAVTPDDVQAMLDTMTDDQFDLVEKIWQYNETHWPELSRIEAAVNGVPPVKVEHVPFTVKGRELPGGYQRIYYHWHQKDKFKIDMHDEANKAMHLSKVTMSKTGATIARVGAGGRKIRLDTENLFRATEDTLQFVAFAEASREVARVAQHPVLSEAIIEKYGRERFQSFMDSIDAVFAGNAQSGHVINTMLRGVRTNLTFGYLALSIRNMVQQPIALTNVMGRVGEMETLKAMSQLASNPVKWAKFVKERSVFMDKRNRFVNREASEQLARIQPASGLGFRPAWGFILQTLGDALVTYPAWLAGYNQGLTKFTKAGRTFAETEKMAITYADEIVASTVGSGLTKDLPPLFQGTGSVAQAVGPEAVKQLTFMGSFFNINYNLYFDAWKRADFKSSKSSANFLREMVWYALVPGILSAWVVGEGLDEEDDESLWAWAAKATGEYGFSSSMFWRNMVSALKGFEPNIPAMKVFSSASRAGKIVTKAVTDDEEEFGKEELAKIIRSLEPMLALPGAGQAARTLEYLDSYEQGDEGEFSIHGLLVEGKDRD